MAYGFNDDKSKVDLLDYVYPIGSIYETVDDTFDPANTWGGTWEKIQGKFLLGSGNGYTSGATGGSADAVVIDHYHMVDARPTLKSRKMGGTTLFIDLVEGNTTSETFTTESQGATVVQNGTDKNMPPYVVVNVWKRTA